MFSEVAETSAKPAIKAGRPRVVTWALVFVVLYLAALTASEATALSKPLRLIAALIPVPAFVLFLIEWIRTIRGSDELERRIQLEALAIAYPLAIVFIMAIGLVQRVVPLDPADCSFRDAWPFLSGFYFLGLVVARRRYR